MARRGHGEGTISLRSDGRWMGKVDLGWHDGKRRRKCLYGATRAEVRDKLNDAVRDAQAGAAFSDTRQTVAQFLQRWLEDVARARVRTRTFDTYEAAVRRHIVPHLGKQPLVKLTPQRAQAWMTTLEEAGVSAHRRRYARVVLRIALKTAIKWRLVSQNVASLIDPPRTTAHEIRPLTPDQAKSLLSAASDGPLHGFVAVALGCGLRLGEALGLKWDDVDLDDGVLRIRRSLQRFGGNSAIRRPLLIDRTRLRRAIATTKDRAARQSLSAQLLEVRKKLHACKTVAQLVEPKSAKSRRTVALPAVTASALRAHRKRQLEDRLAAGDDWKGEGFVFCTPIGTAADPHNINRQFRLLLKTAGLPPTRIHDMRHTAATLLLAQGVDPRTIMEVLGHSQISVTLNTYTHVMPTLRRDAATKLDAVLSG